MLTITIPETEFYNSEKQEFFKTKETKLQLEHSLVSISKWESKYMIPFIDTKEKTKEQILYYIKCMTINQNVDDTVYSSLTDDLVSQIVNYIQSPMTATTITDTSTSKSTAKEKLTSELIYYAMTAYNIPWEAQKWHLNRLITLIKICQIKNEPQKKMTAKDLAKRNSALNAARRKQLNTRG